MLSSVAPHTRHTHHVAFKTGQLVGRLVKLVQDGLYFVLCTPRHLYRRVAKGGERREANKVGPMQEDA
jgi:hypothetical protein